VRNKFGLVILGVTLIGVSGCSHVPDAVNPISWYRDATGLSKNDNLGKGENEENLAEGGNQPYPNLASVPSAPDTQLSGVERDKLEKSLVADRSNAQYSADNLRAGDVASTVPPPAPAARNAPEASNAPANSRAGASAPESESASPAPPLPTVTASAVPPPAEPSAPAIPAAPSNPPVAATPAAPSNPSATASAAASAPPSPPPSSSAGSNLLGSNTRQKQPPRGSEAPPAESSLQSPTIPNLPQGENPTPAPPPPQIPPPNANRVASAAPPAATRTPEQQAAAPGNAPATAAARRPGAPNRVANVSFAPGSAYLASGLRDTIGEIVKQHDIEGGTIRIVGFGEATGKDAAVAGFTLALDRAQAVAAALTDAGVAAKDIAVEAAPVPAKGGADAPRAEVYLEH